MKEAAAMAEGTGRVEAASVKAVDGVAEETVGGEVLSTVTSPTTYRKRTLPRISDGAALHAPGRGTSRT